MKAVYALASFLVFQLVAAGQTSSVPKPPIIDVHLHALPANWLGKPGFTFCAGEQILFPGVDPRTRITPEQLASCPTPLAAPLTDEEVMRKTIAALERYNIRAVASGPPQYVAKWKVAAPERIIPGLLFSTTRGFTPGALRERFQKGEFSVLGEVLTQYDGVSPSDSALEPYLALAEELDIPVGIHMGLGPPGAAHFFGSPGYRAGLSNPLLLEEALIRHPKLRIYVMHAGWPMLDEMINLLYAHPQVYADVGVIDWYLPRKEFHQYLRRLVEAGFGKRLMFGSDQMIWPQGIGLAIESIESADFLTAEQKRDIFYNNAARFLRLDQTPPKEPGNKGGS